MRILILGAEGLVGRTFLQLCRGQRCQVLGTSRRQADITDFRELLRLAEAFRPTHIVNCAAFTNVDAAEKDPKSAFSVNVLGTENVGKVARLLGAKIVHISTDYVFSGSEGSKPFIESDVTQPVGVYAKTKREGEERLFVEYPSACVIRTSWVFGLGGRNFLSQLVPLMREKEELKIAFDQISKPTYAPDLADAIFHLLCHSGVFHFANEGATSRVEIAQEILKKAEERGSPLKCQNILPIHSSSLPPGAPRPVYSVLSTDKVDRFLGRPPRHWSGAIHEFLEVVG